MMKYIERDAFIAHLEKDPLYPLIEKYGIRGVIEAFPAADVVPVRHGRWIWNDDGMDWGIGSWLCSACYARPETWWQGWESINPYRFSGSHYCPNCGAKMEVEE